MTTQFKRKVLAIDGGGIRGIIPAMVLHYIEEKTGKPIADLFDFIAGTSTGGILALGLTKRNSDYPLGHEPEYTAEELVNFYHQYGRRIFTESIPTAIDDYILPKYSQEGRQEVLENLLGGAKIEDALREVLIPSYDIELREPIFFTSNPQAEQPKGYSGRKICTGFTMVEAAMATSAAPTFFPPYKLDTAHYTAEGYYALVDGGVFVNNPASLAMMEAMISYKREKAKELLRTETLVVSLGTGSLTRQYSYKKAKNWGQIQWALPILNVVMDGQSEGVAYQLNDLMVSEGDHRNYYRFQLPLTSDDQHDQMDNASPENLEYLSKRGRRLIDQEQESLDQLCDQLLQDQTRKGLAKRLAEVGIPSR